MRYLVLLGILCLLGCQSIVGPLQYRRPVRIDDPTLPIPEQERLGRDRLAIPDESYPVGPNPGVLPSDIYGR